MQAALHKGYLTISAAKSAEETVEGKYLRREMCGIFITPIEKHFEKITKEDVKSILEQVSF